MAHENIARDHIAAWTDQKTAHPDRAKMASAIRALAIDAVEAAKSGHPGMPMGMADVATVLFEKHLKFDPSAPAWPDRDRFVLSAGHGSMLLYALLHLTGYADMPLHEIRRFRQLHSAAAGHPEYGEAGGIETTTGPLGQGLANAVGMAMAERLLAARYGDKVVDHRTFVIAGDGCLMEGVSQEAITLAGHLKLGKLVVLWDDNGISIDGAISLADSTDQLARFEASGWRVMRIDGHDFDEIDAALAQTVGSDKPVMIACRTVIGFGAPKKAGTSGAHGSPLGPEEAAAAKAAIGWTAAPFEVPKDVAALWGAVGQRGAAAHGAWAGRIDGVLSPRRRAEFDRMISGALPGKLPAAVKRLKQRLSESGEAVATRRASEIALETLLPLAPEMIGGSADLTGSNNTKAGGIAPITGDDFSGRYVHWGVREHGMAAAMNGMALHGGVAPYGGTFLVFSDYARPAIRLAALMKLRVVHVATHDSIGLGEDGPTHQPVEHLAALRAIPNLAVYRPADAVETVEAWECALEDAERPSVLALSRQNLACVRREHTPKNLTAQGAYILAEASAAPKAILIASGSEVEIALAARARLEAEGVPTRVVSAPCLERFAEQDEKTRKKVLPKGPARVAVEAGVRMGWDQWLCGERGDARKAAFVGMQGFGASAPAKELYAHFGITADAVAAAARALL